MIEKIINNEWQSGVQNNRNNDYESYIDLLDSFRDEKNYEWMSNIRIPEFASQMLTQSSIDVDQYFNTRDFIEVYIQDESNRALAAAEANKECINRTLNRKDLYYYLKYVRAKLINHLMGEVWAVCWWDKKIKKVKSGSNISVDAEGKVTENAQIKEVIAKDGFDFDIFDVRDVAYSSEYVYSPQDKKWIITRSQKTYEELTAVKDIMEYDLTKLDEEMGGVSYADSYRTETDPESNPVNKYFDILTRYGKFWAVVTKKDPDTDEPLEVKKGIGEDGKKLKKAKFLEVVITVASVPVLDSSQNKLFEIGFKLQPFKDHADEPYRPILRGLCYVHPSKDSGIGDGKYGRELQTAVDDTFNLNNDRTQLAIMPTFIGRKNSLENNSTVYFEPEHVIEVDDINTDIRELQISDNIQGGLTQLDMLIAQMNKVMAIFPGTQGSLPTRSSTTATAIAGAEQRTDTRGNYKTSTFEYTFLTDMYWMITQMTLQFAEEETGFKLMGKKLFNFDPGLDFYYKPLSQSIESDHSKAAKVQVLTQILGYVSNVKHPDAPKVFNYIIGRIATYMGDESVNAIQAMLNPEVPIEGGEGSVTPGSTPATNQSGVAQTQQERLVRDRQTQ